MGQLLEHLYDSQRRIQTVRLNRFMLMLGVFGVIQAIADLVPERAFWVMVGGSLSSVTISHRDRTGSAPRAAGCSRPESLGNAGIAALPIRFYITHIMGGRGPRSLAPERSSA